MSPQMRGEELNRVKEKVELCNEDECANTKTKSSWKKKKSKKREKNRKMRKKERAYIVDQAVS